MLAQSDNTVAEAMARQVAIAQGLPATFDGAAEAMTRVLTLWGLPADEFHIADASGYSHENQLAPSVLTSLLVRAASGKYPALAQIFDLLPVAGWSGTVTSRFGKPDTANARGMVRAKTGTLDGVNSISGVVQTADGAVLAFSVLAMDVPVRSSLAPEALDRIVAKIASCGCS